MADHDETAVGEVETGPEAANPAAVAIALSKTSKANKAVDEEAVAFLREQRSLIDAQKAHLHEQFKHLRLRYWGERLKLILQSLTIVVGVLLFAVVGAMALDASRYRGLEVEAFYAPRDFSARGMDGRMLASKVMDKIAEMDASGQSVRAPSTYENDWKGDIKIAVPETGVSLGELRQYLRQWLGHPTRISGEAARTSEGLSLTVRTDGEPGFTVAGPEADLDRMIGEAAEKIYGATQPYQYSKWLEYHDRGPEALATARRLAVEGPPQEQAWAWAQVSDLLVRGGDAEAAATAARRALAINPRLIVSLSNARNAEFLFGHSEAALAMSRRLVDLENHGAPEISPRALPGLRASHRAGLDILLGDRQAAAAGYAAMSFLPDVQSLATDAGPRRAAALAMAHDATGSRRLRDEMVDPETDVHLLYTLNFMPELTAQYEEAAEVGDWRRAIAIELQVSSAASAKERFGQVLADRYAASRLAYAQARAGDLAAAQETIAATPPDCDFCIRTRGRIAALARDWASADRAFAEVVRRAPSPPFAYEEWGRTLLDRGDAKTAAAKAAIAVDKGPRFADAKELWGEALLAQGQGRAAVVKFEAAASDAPRWGRNRLMWAQALLSTGEAALARQQLLAAREMDLTPTDRAMVVRLLGRASA